jgi:excisionase family DNA binding protein
MLRLDAQAPSATPINPPRRVSAQEVAGMLGVSARTVLREAAAGRMPGAMRVATRWTFDREMIETWITSRTTPLPPPEPDAAPEPRRNAAASRPTSISAARLTGSASKLKDAKSGAAWGQTISTLLALKRRASSAV